MFTHVARLTVKSSWSPTGNRGRVLPRPGGDGGGGRGGIGHD